MRKFLAVVVAIFGTLPFIAQAEAVCPISWRDVTFYWPHACEVIAQIQRAQKVGGEVSDNSPEERRVAVVDVCRKVCGGLDFAIEPKDPREVLYRIRGGRVCLAPGEGVRESPNPGAALAELSEETRQRCEKVVEAARLKKRKQ